MKRILLFLAIGLLIALFVLLGVYYFVKNKEPATHITLYGNVDVRQVDIAFRVSGKVDTLHFQEGDLVKKGDLMAFLETTPYDSQLAEAQARVEAIRPQFENAQLLLKRRQELIGVGGVSQEDLDDATANYERLQADLAQAEAQLQVAQDQLSYTQAYAPNEGILLTRIREPGSVVKEAEPVYTLSLTDPVWIRAFVSEPQLGQVFYGMEAEVSTDIKGGKVYKGRVGFISPISEFTPKTVETTQLRTDLVYRLRIYIDKPDPCLKQGMPVTVKLKLRNCV
jgi:HlyD family secretion protein